MYRTPGEKFMQTQIQSQPLIIYYLYILKKYAQILVLAFLFVSQCMHEPAQSGT